MIYGNIVGGSSVTPDKAFPPVTEFDNGKMMQVVNGKWQPITFDELSVQMIDKIVVIGSDEPTHKCLWFDATEPEEPIEELLFLFTMDDIDIYAVQAESDGEQYGVMNATIGGEPTDTTYNFTII